MIITIYHNWRNEHGEKNHLIDLAQNRLEHDYNACNLYEHLFSTYEDKDEIDIHSAILGGEDLGISRSELIVAMDKLIEQGYLVFIKKYSTEYSNLIDNCEFHFYEYSIKQPERKGKDEFTITFKATYIPGYEGLYGLTEDGQVWSEYSNRFLKPQSRGRGKGQDNKVVSLFKNKKGTYYTIGEIKEMVEKAKENGVINNIKRGI